MCGYTFPKFFKLKYNDFSLQFYVYIKTQDFMCRGSVLKWWCSKCFYHVTMSGWHHDFHKGIKCNLKSTVHCLLSLSSLGRVNECSMRLFLTSELLSCYQKALFEEMAFYKLVKPHNCLNQEVFQSQLLCAFRRITI